jgi:hypothetical protein
MSIKKLSLVKETLTNLTANELEQVQGAGRKGTNYTCNGSVGIACTVLTCKPAITVNQYTCNGSVGIACTVLNCAK